MATTIARVTEINATSDVSFEDAINAGIARAHKTLRGVKGAWIKEQKVIVKEGVIKSYRVNLLVTFVVDD
jgi:flavin-binding protein dodecin